MVDAVQGRQQQQHISLSADPSSSVGFLMPAVALREWERHGMACNVVSIK
jgi:hypothetical protein